ncbi:MAG: 8-oxo-dGTP diphosphatase MutT [Pseudomonadota bacterium]
MPNTGPEPASPAPLRVVAGIILAPAADRILLARRPLHKHLGGLWEFPGGKLEAGEAAAAGLTRELREELGIRVLASEFFLCIDHDYGDCALRLEAWLVRAFAGQPVGREGQAIAWVERTRLGDWPMPAANRPIAAALRAAVP